MDELQKKELVAWVVAIAINLISTFIVWLLKKLKLIPLSKSIPFLFIVIATTILGLSYYFYSFQGLFYTLLIYIGLTEIGVALYLYTDFKFMLIGIHSIGVYRTYPVMKEARNMGVSEYDIASQVKREFKFCTISGRSIYTGSFEELLKEKAKDSCNFYFLFFDPDSEFFEGKMLSEGSEVNNSKEKIKTATRSLCELKNTYKLNIHVRWYKDYPIWRFIIADQEKAYVGFYPPSKKGYMGPWVVFKDIEGSFFHPFSKYFDTLWGKAIIKC